MGFDDKLIVSAGGYGNYKVNNRLDERLLTKGVKYWNDKSESTTEPGVDIDGPSAPSTELAVEGRFYVQNVTVLNIEGSADVKIVAYANTMNNQWNMTTLTDLINLYNNNNPRYRVLGAINADFFYNMALENQVLNFPYQTEGPLACNGENYRTLSSGKDRMKSAIGIINGKNKKIYSTLELKRSSKPILKVYGKTSFLVDKFNEEPSIGETSIYFSYYDKNHNINDIDCEINNGSMIYVVNNAIKVLPGRFDRELEEYRFQYSDFYGKGAITSLYSTTTNIKTTKDSFIIVTKNKELISSLNTNQLVRVQFEFLKPFKKALNIVGTAPKFLDKGKYNPEAVGVKIKNLCRRGNRTCIGIKEDGSIVMASMDGRDISRGFHGGMGTEFAAMMKYYGCYNAWGLDGGGSTTMVVKLEDGTYKVMNGVLKQRAIGSCLLIVERNKA